MDVLSVFFLAYRKKNIIPEAGDLFNEQCYNVHRSSVQTIHKTCNRFHFPYEELHTVEDSANSVLKTYFPAYIPQKMSHSIIQPMLSMVELPQKKSLQDLQNLSVISHRNTAVIHASR